jgi:hypothetical protein
MTESVEQQLVSDETWDALSINASMAGAYRPRPTRGA